LSQNIHFYTKLLDNILLHSNIHGKLLILIIKLSIPITAYAK